MKNIFVLAILVLISGCSETVNSGISPQAIVGIASRPNSGDAIRLAQGVIGGVVRQQQQEARRRELENQAERERQRVAELSRSRAGRAQLARERREAEKRARREREALGVFLGAIGAGIVGGGGSPAPSTEADYCTMRPHLAACGGTSPGP